MNDDQFSDGMFRFEKHMKSTDPSCWIAIISFQNQQKNAEQRLHREIYLSEAGKVAPEKLKTVIRHPIKKYDKLRFSEINNFPLIRELQRNILMPKYSEQDLKYAADFRDEIHKEALTRVKAVYPDADHVIDDYPADAYF